MGEIEEIIAAAPWRFAKTMPHMPHEYGVEGKSLDPASFRRSSRSNRRQRLFSRMAPGPTPGVVDEHIGHSTVAFALDTYSRAIPSMQAEAAETIASLVKA